jgi:TAP-like protein
VDASEPWDWSTPVLERQEQFATVSELPTDFFAPFSRVAGTSLGVSYEKQCLSWQKPTPFSPVTPEHPTYPYVPTLMVSGDTDALVPTEEVRPALSPESTFLSVAEAGHVTATWTLCSANLQAQFFDTLQVGDTSCTETPETVWPALGRFPLIATNALPAEIDPAGANQVDPPERRVVTVAVTTATDALKRSTIGSGSGAWAQVVVATVPAGSNPSAIAVNQFVTAPRLDSWLQQHWQNMLSHI